MKVERLILRDFRNVRECSFSPDKHLNVLVGANGQGKTSVLEALGFLATLRSFRGSKAPEVIQWGRPSAEVQCTLRGDDWTTDLKTSFVVTDPVARKARKLAHINGKAYTSSTQYLSQRFGSYELGFHAVVFNPADHDLVRSEPSVRRSFLDRVISAEDVEYLKQYTRYERLLAQRNAVLKLGDSSARELLLGFTEPLAELAAIIAYKRLAWISRLAGPLNETAHHIAPAQPDLRLIYLSNWVPKIEGLCLPNNNLGQVHFAGHDPLPSLELLEQAFWNKASTLEAAEWKSGHTLVGPHRDDWTFLLGGQVLRGHGSQGEVRSALLALKLSEIELFRNETGHRPIFLLDDFSSELDSERRSYLLRFLIETELQTFISTTELSSSVDLGIGKRFEMRNGELKELSERRHDHAADRPS